MTNPTPITEDTETPSVPLPVPDVDEETSETSPVDDDPDRAEQPDGRKYRQRLRQTELERDALAERIASADARIVTMQRAEVERLSGAVLQAGADVWLAGATLDEVLTDGDVDPAAVAAVAAGIVKDRPHFQRRYPSAAPASMVSGESRIDSQPPVGWSDVLRNPAGRAE